MEDFLDWLNAVEKFFDYSKITNKKKFFDYFKITNKKKFFDYSKISNKKKVKVVAYKLTGGASAW